MKKEIEKKTVIVYNALVTPDGTTLETTNRHDYKSYVDANGKTYMIDGGHDYTRSSINGDEKMIQITSDMPHEIVRKYAFRTGYGKPGTEAYGKNYLLTRLCNMNDEYLEASILYKIKLKQIGSHLDILLDEQIYRIKNNIVVDENESEILN